MTAPLPLVYSCSGCSNAGQLANALAMRLHRERLAEMSCIAGVGGGVPSLVRLARQERPILALDGCPLGCVAACLERVGVTHHFCLNLATFGVRKKQDFQSAPDEQDRLWTTAVRPALDALLAGQMATCHS